MTARRTCRPRARIRFTSAILPRWARRSREPRCAVAGALSARRLDRRFPGGAGRPARGGGAEPVARRDLAPHGRLAGGLRPLAAPRSRRPAVTSTSGPMGSTSRPGWSRRPSASWSSSERRRRGGRNCVGFQVGVRESAQSWRELLVDLKARGLAAPPELAVGRRRPGLLEGAGRGLPRHPSPALLGAQGLRTCSTTSRRPCSRPSPLDLREISTRRNSRRRAGRHRDLQGEIRRSNMPARGGLLDQGYRGARWPSTTSRPSIGTTCAPRTRSRASSPPSAIAPCEPRARCRRGPRS